MSPFFYDVFADSLLEYVYERCFADGVPVGVAGRTKPAAAYADDLMALAATSAGLQRIINAVRAHSLKYGWTLNLNKTLVLVFGSEQLRTEQQGVRFFWGDAELRRAAAVKYLGIHFSDDMSWATHIAEAARKGWASYHAWAPVLASSRIHVATKKRLIDTYMRPAMEYGIELWGTPLVPSDKTSLQGIDLVLEAACRLACGIRATPTEHAWQRRACVKPHVLLSDMDVLPAVDVACVANLRYAERARVADVRAAGLLAHDAASPAFQSHLPASRSPDFMNAAIRAAMPVDDAWMRQAAHTRALVRAHMGDHAPPLHVKLSNAAIRAAVAALRRTAWHGCCPSNPEHSTVSSRGRRLRVIYPRAPLLCPLTLVLQPAAHPSYMRAPDSAALCVLMLRSAHLPGDHCLEARESYDGDICGDCGEEVLTVQDAVPPDERRWLHVQHALLACHACNDRRPSPRQLREALLSAAHEHADTLAAVADAFPLDEADPSVLRECGVPYMLDPVQSCPGPRLVRLLHVALIAAYIELVAADFCGRAADPVRLAALRLPSDSCLRTFYPRPDPPPPPALVDLRPPALGSLCMHARVPLVSTRRVDIAENVCLVPSVLVHPVLPASALATVPCGCTSAVHASSASSSDDEIWLRDDPRPSSPPVFTPVCSAPVGAEADGALPYGAVPD